MRFADFCELPQVKRAELHRVHVLVLRFYTTAAFRSLNDPLRDRQRQVPHPLAVTIAFLAEGLRRLRAVDAAEEDATERLDLWRGMHQTGISGATDFFAKGGTELAPMSTTANLQVAVTYAASAHALVFKVPKTS